MTSEYEKIRERNIATNRALLLSLKLSGPSAAPLVPKAEKHETAPAAADSDAGSDATVPRKRARKSKAAATSAEAPNNASGNGSRRSSRLQGIKAKAAELADDSDSESDAGSSYERAADSDIDSDREKPQRKKRALRASSSYDGAKAQAKRRRTALPNVAGVARKVKSLVFAGRPDPKVFGEQVGTEVGDWWAMRIDCSQAGVHAPTVAGIAGNEAEGCWSIALSGGYEDDVDLGYAFTYTGSGGRDLKGTASAPKNLRTAPQTSDQTFTGLNASLQVSAQTKNPIRVIRGFKNHGPFAPEDGYRYDGLYVVEKCWREKGQAGFLVCKYAFVRLPNQPKIPVKPGREAEAEQMYRDMGFQVENLPSTPEQRKVWSKKMARERIQASKVSAAEVGKEEQGVKEEDAATTADGYDTPSLATSEPVAEAQGEAATDDETDNKEVREALTPRTTASARDTSPVVSAEKGSGAGNVARSSPKGT